MRKHAGKLLGKDTRCQKPLPANAKDTHIPNGSPNKEYGRDNDADGENHLSTNEKTLILELKRHYKVNDYELGKIIMSPVPLPLLLPECEWKDTPKLRVKIIMDLVLRNRDVYSYLLSVRHTSTVAQRIYQRHKNCLLPPPIVCDALRVGRDDIRLFVATSSWVLTRSGVPFAEVMNVIREPWKVVINSEFYNNVLTAIRKAQIVCVPANKVISIFFYRGGGIYLNVTEKYILFLILLFDADFGVITTQTLPEHTPIQFASYCSLIRNVTI